MTFAVGWALKTIIYFRQLQEACKGNEAPIMPKKLQAIAFLFTVQGSACRLFFLLQYSVQLQHSEGPDTP